MHGICNNEGDTSKAYISTAKILKLRDY